jgi:hypothetical protein
MPFFGRRHILLLGLLILVLRPLSSQDRAELEQRYQSILERPLGVAPAIDDDSWSQLVQMALDAPSKEVSLQTKTQAHLTMLLDNDRAYCRISVSDQLSYELMIAPWSIDGDYPIVQISTIERPYRVSHLTAFLPHQDKHWNISSTISRADWIRREEKQVCPWEDSSHLLSIEEIPLVLTFAPEPGKQAISVCASLSLNGWTTREVSERLARYLSPSTFQYRLTRQGKWERIK